MKYLFLLLLLFIGCADNRPWNKIDTGKVISIIPRGGDSHRVYVYVDSPKMRYNSLYYSDDCFFMIGDKVTVLSRGDRFYFQRLADAEKE